ncbi:methyltransferase [Synergistales bacterium]|nr:methyltransferase [Synergistales bacterium]
MEHCRFCGELLTHVFADLGATPVSTSFVHEDEKEWIYPLCVRVCERCLLVQAQMFETPENIFSDYAYFSSISKPWLEHCRQYSDHIIKEYMLSTESFVVEIASNDGYLLQNFVEKNIPVLGVEPAKNIARQAVQNGVPTLCDFFGEEIAKKIARQHGKADLLIGNNVFAHVPNINDFVAGLKTLLGERAILTLEFPSLSAMISNNEWDTIYHEHFYYFSLIAVKTIFQRHGLRVFNVEELWTHGGSYRIYGCHAEDTSKPDRASVDAVLQKELGMGFDKIDTYMHFSELIKKTKRDTLSYLISKKNIGARIVAFGAPAKGATFLNYCGIGTDFIDYIVDETPYKQGLFMPGARIQVFPLEKLMQDRPDYVVILPWNWTDEILKKLQFMKEYGGKAVTFIPGIKEYF